jgi:hypothetical protein
METVVIKVLKGRKDLKVEKEIQVHMETAEV